MRIHQLSFGMHAGDAVSNHVLDIDANLKSWGYTSHMYAQHVAPEMQGRVLLDNAFAPYLSEPNDLLIYHYSIYSPNTRLFRSAQTKRILIYHNITPAHFFHAWDARQAAMCALGRQKLPHLADCDFALSDSEFNRQELIAAGFDKSKTAVLPFHITPTQFNRHTNDSTKRPGIINWLTVGRIVPNKAIEELIRLFAVYHKTINAASHLYIVGSRTIEPYAHQLDQLI
ncbi:MAG: glycosyltransferase family 4 protein, partial [Chloroflexi bacterium]|nr:glycosyltransferase family 4 protein [Chloroflexota bacterium]